MQGADHLLPSLPPKPNLCEVSGRMASADLQNSGDHQSNTLRSQLSAAYGRDQSRFDI